jgi:hypothetical protein
MVAANGDDDDDGVEAMLFGFVWIIISVHLTTRLGATEEIGII